MARKKYRKKKPFPKEVGAKRSKVRELVKKYGMDELVALEIANGVLPLEVWLERQEQQKRRKFIKRQLEKQVAGFSTTSPFSLPLSADVLKGTYALMDYRQQKCERLELEKKAGQIADENEISLDVARSIAAGKFTLEEYLTREKHKRERRKKAKKMAKEHPDLAIETCYQIVDEGVSVEDYLNKREKSKQKRGNWYRNYLKDRFQDNKYLNMYLGKLRKHKIPVVLFLFNLETVWGSIVEYTPYEIKIRDTEGTETLYPKLQIKFMCRVSYMERVLSLLKVDKELQKHPLYPEPNPYDRYRFPPKSPQQGQRLEITLGEGERLAGKVKWFSRYDLKLTLAFSPKTTVMVFRHAVVDVKILR